MFFSEINAGLADPTTIAEKKERFSQKPDAATAKALASYFQTQNEVKQAVLYYNQALKFDPKSDFSEELFELYTTGFRRKIYSLGDLMAMADKALAARESDIPFRLTVYAQMSDYAGENPHNQKLLGYIESGYQLLQDHADQAPAWSVRYLNINHALFVEKDPDKALTLKKSSLKEGWENDAGQLNGFAWWCFENKLNLDEAAELARRGAKLAEPGRSKAMILDTAAEIENLRGNPAEAFKLMEQAVKEDPVTEHWKKQLERFKKVMAKS